MAARRVFINFRTIYYINKIRHAKKEHWLRIVRLSGEADPWGLAYKILANKFKKSAQMVSMRSGNTVLTRPNDICKFFLGGLLPDDTIDTDNPESMVICLLYTSRCV